MDQTNKKISIASTLERTRANPWFGLWPLAPTILFLGIVFLYPVIQLLWLSAVDNQGNLSLDHYAKLFSSSVYVRVLIITFKIAFWTTVIALIAGYPVAYLLATSTERTRSFLILWVLMPFWTSFLVRTFGWIVLLGREGVINDSLVASGLTNVPIDLIYNFTGTMIGMVHTLMPLAVLTMLAVMQNIDPNLVRAAGTLGGRGGQAFWRIYFPLSLPGVAAGGLLVFSTALGFFITPQLLGGREEMMIAQIIIFQLEELLNWGFAGAVSVMLLAATMAVFYIYDRMLGMSTLTGSAAAPKQQQKRNLLGTFGHYVGEKIIAALGATSAALGFAYDAIFPPSGDRPRTYISRGVLWACAMAVVFFLVVPSFFVIPVSFTTGKFIEWPPIGFSLQWYQEYFSSEIWRAATIRSLLIGIATGILAMLVGMPAAFIMTRKHVPARTAVMAFILSPLIVPHIIVAVALYYFFAKIGLVGTSFGLILGHTIFALPFVIVTLMAVLKNYDERLDQAAWSLGATKLTTLRLITIPLIKAGILAAFLFAFVRSFDELTVALFITGGRTATLPKQMWSDAVLNVSPGLTAVSTVILIFVTVAILGAEYLNRRARRLSGAAR